jgi:hypothetical protein
VVGLLGTHRTWPRVANLPAGQGYLDAAPDLSLVGGFRGEQDADRHLVAGGRGSGVVRREGTGRLVFPMATQGHRDGRADGPGVAVRFDDHHGGMGECLAHEFSIDVS